ncbi:TMEM198/TM7SF3 family protein [Aspergillus nidulans FGSC A4]|uniref:TM7S3/TM198-like domain-containing protein n=1 Tax=Emericella nidulans (strain FGSC A4 / ATCC 38163 / CBS 112.46 / NRRL 194 / M139) TaxID=227321 RepID=C8VDK8_EMENI|nr:hypothetical protein [Aspergillus nidulans FGSC A4]CBF80015.1 TPA: hypothetical protein ANIA_11018 [Aspergillus nidulans FGSC A4]
MRVHYLLPFAYLIPALAFVARVHVDRGEHGPLLSRDLENEPASNTTIANVNATNNATATQTSNSTTPSVTTVPTLNTSTPDEGERPCVGGFILLVAGAILALIGVRNLWVQVFLSSAFLTSLGVTVLIVYVMNPPVRVAIQGAYLIAIFFTGITFGALALVFKELAEGLGCLLGGFCTSMWLLCTRPGGLIEASDAKTGFIGAISVAFYAVSFSHHTRPYGLIISTSVAGGTAVSLGIDCYSKAGLKEFWLYLWALNDGIFPLGTETFPVTRHIKVELAVTVIVAIMGVISQLRLWKVVRERRAHVNEKQQEEQMQRDEAEAEVGKRLEEDNMKERMEWEAKYGDRAPGASESSASIPEPTVCYTDEGEGKDKKKDKTAEEKSISDSVVSYRCSDCRARGEDSTTDTNTAGSEPSGQEIGSADRDIRTLSQNAEGDDGYPKALRGAMEDDKSSGITAIAGSETVSVYSKRFSMLSRKSSVKSAAKSVKSPEMRVSESQEALIGHNDDVDSTIAVVDDVNSDCHTVAANSDYQTTLDGERPALSQKLVVTNAMPMAKTDKQAHGDSKSASKDMPQPTDPSSTANPGQIDETQKVANADLIPDAPNPEEPVGPVDLNNQDQLQYESVDSQAEQLQDSAEAHAHSNEEVQLQQQATTAGDTLQSEKNSPTGQCSDHDPPDHSAKGKAGEHAIQGQNMEGKSNKSTRDQVSQADIKGESREDLMNPEPMSSDNKSLKLSTEKNLSREQEEQAPKKEEPKPLNAETVQQIPKHTSRVVQAYRMNEWAKHLTNADVPDPEPIQQFEDQDPDQTEEAAAPVNVSELLQTPLNAQPLPAVESRRDTNESHHAHDSRTGSQKTKKRSSSPKRLSGQSAGSGHLSQNLHSAVQPLGIIATPSSVTLLPPAEQGLNESEKAKPRWKGPTPLMAVREDMMRSRLSSLSLPTDPYARRSTGQSPTDFSSRYRSGSTFAIPELDDDDVPLSQRRAMLHEQATPVSPTNAAPSRANSPAVLAAWREFVREDLGKRDPLKLSQSTSLIPGARSASPFGQPGQRNTPSVSLGDKIAEGMQRGDMSDLHREALRRMQAKANQSVNRLV